MLLRFRLSNYRSFRDEQELSLIGSKHVDGRAGIQVAASKENVLPVCAIYGSNASGKSNLLKALHFVVGAVLNSHRRWEPGGSIPLDTFRLGAPTAEATFEVDFLVAGVRYQFGFCATHTEITGEWLFSYPSGKKKMLFSRLADGEIDFGRSLQGDNKTIAALMRKNSLFLSTAAQNNHETLSPVYSWFQHGLVFSSGEATVPLTTLRLCADEEHRKQIASLMAFADLGITDLVIDKKPRETTDEVARALDAIFREFEIMVPLPDMSIPGEVAMIHRIGDASVSFDSDHESNGTKTYFALAGPVISALETGTVLVVDELDSSLHPNLTSFLVRLFATAASNPKGGQLVFTTHDTTLLDNRTQDSPALNRDEIWLVQKDASGASSLYPLSDFKPVKGEDTHRFYLSGRFGGVPFINTERIVERLRSNG